MDTLHLLVYFNNFTKISNNYLKTNKPQISFLNKTIIIEKNLK